MPIYSLLQMHSDQKILIKNLEKLNLDAFHPLVLEVYQERAKRAVASFAETEAGQLRLYNVLNGYVINASRCVSVALSLCVSY
jgi:hypothetical protein